MLKNIRDFNSTNKNKKSIKQNKLDGKKELFNKIKSKEKESPSVENMDSGKTEVDAKYKDLYKKAKIEIKQLNKKIKEMEVINSNTSKDIDSDSRFILLKDKLNNKHNELVDTKNQLNFVLNKLSLTEEELRSLKEESDKDKNLIRNMESDLIFIKQETKRKNSKWCEKEKFLINKNKQLEEYNENLNTENETINKRLLKVQSSLDNLKANVSPEKIKEIVINAINNKEIDFKGIYNSLVEDNNYNYNNKEKNIIINFNSNEMDISKFIEFIFDNMTTDNVEECWLASRLSEKYYRLLDLKRENVKNEKSKNHEKEVKWRNKSRELLVEHVIKEYKNSQGEHIYDLTNDHFTERVSTKLEIIPKIKKAKDNEVVKKRRNRYGHIVDKSIGDGKRVLIISTPKEGVKYRNYIRKYTGFEVEYVNSFEKHPTHVKNLMDKADIVIMCTDKMTHSAFYSRKNLSQKYQLIHDDNTKSVYDLIMYAYSKV